VETYPAQSAHNQSSFTWFVDGRQCCVEWVKRLKRRKYPENQPLHLRVSAPPNTTESTTFQKGVQGAETLWRFQKDMHGKIAG
jgi:hypothetical protein